MTIMLNEFGQSLVRIKWLFVILTIIILICSIPLYVLKGTNSSSSYVTHSHQYRWYYTVAYFSGTIPSLFLMTLCFLSLLTFLFSLRYLLYIHDSKNGDEQQQEQEQHEQLSSLHSSIESNETRNETLDTEIHSPSLLSTSTRRRIISSSNYFYFCLILFLVISILATVNGLYVWSTLQTLSYSSRVMIQFSLSFFGILWRSFIRSIIIPKSIKNSLLEIWLLSYLGVITGVIIPCLATALTSPLCYQVSHTLFSPVLVSY
jgi:hypothetical protein